MSKSSGREWAERVNAARVLTQKHESRAEAAAALSRKYGISKRQAYRYLEAAQKRDTPLLIPESKVVFTVKLPEGLVEALRQHAAYTKKSLGAVVAQALEAYLGRGRG